MFKKYLQIVLVVFILFAIGLVQRSFENSTEYQLRPIVFFGCQFTSLAISLATLEFLRKIKNQLIRFFFTLGASSLVAVVAFIFFTSEVELLLLLRVAIAFSMAFTIAERMQLLDYRSQELRELYEKKEKIERALLSQQLNPHFLFNSLNNIYSLALTKNDKVPDLILRLSDLMRHIIYESRENYISLQKEIEFVDNFIALQKIRTSGKTLINYTKTGDVQDGKIAPLLFEPFIDNAFKHGLPGTENDFIDILFDFSTPEYVLFKLRNNYENREISDSKNSGIGIRNVEQRLQHLYSKGDYKLSITKEQAVFSISLELKLK